MGEEREDIFVTFKTMGLESLAAELHAAQLQAQAFASTTGGGLKILGAIAKTTARDIKAAFAGPQQYAGVQRKIQQAAFTNLQMAMQRTGIAGFTKGPVSSVSGEVSPLAVEHLRRIRKMSGGLSAGALSPGAIQQLAALRAAPGPIVGPWGFAGRFGEGAAAKLASFRQVEGPRALQAGIMQARFDPKAQEMAARTAIHLQKEEEKQAKATSRALEKQSKERERIAKAQIRATKEFQVGLKNLSHGVENAARRVSGFFSGFTIFVTAMNAWSAAIGVQAVSALADFGFSAEVTNKVFGEVTKNLGESADTLLPKLNDALGGSVARLQQMALVNQLVASGAGLTADQLVKLAAASKNIALVSGKPVSETFAAITEAAAAGNTGGLRAYGIHQTPGELLGTKGTESEQRKAAFDIITARGAEAGKMLGGVDTDRALAVQKLGAAWRNFGEEMAQVMVNSGAADNLINGLKNTMQSVMDLVANDPDAVSRIFKNASEAISAVVSMAPGLVRAISEIMDKLVEWTGSAENLVKTMISLRVAAGALTSVSGILRGIGGLVGGGAGIAITGLGPLGVAAGAGLVAWELLSSMMAKSVATSFDEKLGPEFESLRGRIEMRTREA